MVYFDWAVMVNLTEEAVSLMVGLVKVVGWAVVVVMCWAEVVTVDEVVMVMAASVVIVMVLAVVSGVLLVADLVGVVMEGC